MHTFSRLTDCGLVRGGSDGGSLHKNHITGTARSKLFIFNCPAQLIGRGGNPSLWVSVCVYVMGGQEPGENRTTAGDSISVSTYVVLIY